jgi:3-phenylpropionate/cinnamic acid dioxygenase small subunit
MDQTTSEALLDRLTALEDQLAISDVYAHYAWLLDSRRWDLVPEEIFAADAELSLGTGMATSRGREEIRANFEAMLPDLEGTAHFFTNVRVDLNGDGTAAAQAYFQSFHWAEETADGGPRRPVDFVGAGVYFDDLRKDPEGWRIFRRRRRNLGPGPLGFGVLPPGFEKRMVGWGGSRDQ